MASISLKYKSKSGNLTAPGDVDPGAMIPIQTITASSGSTISFTNIPQNYSHLQFRCYLNATNISGNLTFNSDTGTNYAKHYLYGDGSSVTASGTASTAGNTYAWYASTTANTYQASIIDILDYVDTNKYKTTRSMTGCDFNGSGFVLFGSGLWMSTSAINTVTFGSNGTFAGASTIALYGIKRAGA